MFIHWMLAISFSVKNKITFGTDVFIVNVIIWVSMNGREI